MNTKRLVLMLLVMLGSVTGAWAQREVNYTIIDNSRLVDNTDLFDDLKNNYEYVRFVDHESNPYSIVIDTQQPIRLGSFKLTPHNSVLPKAVSVEGSNDNSSWTMLQSGDYSPERIAVDCETQYRYYRFSIEHDAKITYLQQLQIYTNYSEGESVHTRLITATVYDLVGNNQNIYDYHCNTLNVGGNSRFTCLKEKNAILRLLYVDDISNDNILSLNNCHWRRFKIYPDGNPFYIDLKFVLGNVTFVFEVDHEHNYPETWTSSDENGHYSICNTTDASDVPCDNKIYEEHIYSDERSTGAAYYTCSICGYVNEKRKHEHVVATEWSYDGDQHWHACLGSEGACDAGKKLDVANHTYGTTGTANYTCTTCGYVDTTRKNAYELPIYKQEKIAALQALVDGIESTLIATKAEEGKTSINQATSKANVETAYNNAASALQALIAVYNDGKNAFTQPTSPGMRLKVTKKDGTIYEFQITDVESTEYYRATE